MTGSSVMQQKFRLLITLVPPTAVSGLTVLSTFESVTPIMSVSERYGKDLVDLLGLEGYEIVGSVSLLFSCNIYKAPHFVTVTSYKSSDVLYLAHFFSQC
jgi:hypothetical protein